MGDDRVIKVEDLSVRYGDDVILQDVTMEVFRGEILVVAGGSGSGKSTLLRHMVGLSKPSSAKKKRKSPLLTATPTARPVKPSVNI